jgi:hypothetical protein
MAKDIAFAQFQWTRRTPGLILLSWARSDRGDAAQGWGVRDGEAVAGLPRAPPRGAPPSRPPEPASTGVGSAVAWVAGAAPGG